MGKEEFVDSFSVPSVKTINFHIGGKEHSVKADDVSPSTSLNSYLRDTLHLNGTKNMCFEGGCGVCVVAVEETINGKTNVRAVNSCLQPLLSCQGLKIHTIEGIGNPKIGYHALQKLLAANNGSQCGFCSGGMIMNMYALQQSGPVSKKQIENSFGGIMCRCTGYRPILEAFKKIASDIDYVPDIEELQECQKDNCKKHCPTCPNQKNNFCVEYGDTKWVRVYNLVDLLTLLKSSNTTNYMLVGGNTAQGIFYESASTELFVDITKVTELVSFSVSNNKLILGANTTITNAMNIFENVSKTSGFAYLNTIKDHFDLIGHVPLRNTGTIAGNLMLKYRHNEFPSDIFLLLEAFKANIVIVDFNGTESTISPLIFLKFDMTKTIIKSIIFDALDDSYKYSSYKIMPRSQNAHGIVIAAFLVKLNNDMVEECNIVYGGINPKFNHAKQAEASLKERKLYDNTTLTRVYTNLNEELVCDHILPDATPAYRKNLAISLFYKFVLKTAPQNAVSARNISGGALIERPVSSSTQEFGTQKENYPVSEAVIKVEALAQTSGQAEYIRDIPDRPYQLFVIFVTAEAPAGSVIQSTDASEALKMPSVEAYFDHTSIPGVNNVFPGKSVVEELFCDGKVKYFHQPVGIIVASQQWAAMQAATMVKIYYDSPQQKPLITVTDVLNAKATERIKQQTNTVATKTGKDVKHVIKGTWYVKQQYHYHMETQCCQIIPTEDGLDMYASTQWMDLNQLSAAKILNIPSNKINVFVRRLGSGFGGKMYRSSFISSATALAAYKLKKPCKMLMSFEDNMKIIGKRIPLYVEYEVGVNDKGVIQYMNTKLYSDFGVGGNERINVNSLFENVYDISTWNFSTYMVTTDTPGNAYTRAPGSTEGLGSIESIMDHIAHVLNMDQMEVRINNMSEQLKPTITNYWNTMQSWGEIADRRAAVDAFNKENRWRKKGMSVVPMAWTLHIYAQQPVLVTIYHGDGTVVISHGGIEMGQGINTKAVQVAAYKFGITMDQVIVKPSYNVIAPNTTPTGGSLTSEAIAAGVIKACDILIERMKPIKDKMTNPTWEQVISACYSAEILLTATGFYSNRVAETQSYPIYGMCATEVEIDILTGQQQINRVDLIEDVGNSISPLIDIGQVEGAFVMGIGYYTTEEIIFTDEGELKTTRTWNYKPPGAKDIPLNFRVKFPENNPNPVGILKSKAIAEPPVCLSISVPLAIRDAVASARIEADSKADKWFLFDGPTTCENTFLNSLNQFDQYSL